jgi:hypothetical protein
MKTIDKDRRLSKKDYEKVAYLNWLEFSENFQ